jgi:hypothetical protein
MARPIKKQVVTEATKMPGIMPLDYMISVIRDPDATQERRDRMAIAAAPYCHPRLTDAVPKGKKEIRQEKAKAANTAWLADIALRRDHGEDARAT